MPQFLENKLRQEAIKKGFSGKHVDTYVFGALQNIGALKGNSPTAKGDKMQAAHVKAMAAGSRKPRTGLSLAKLMKGGKKTMPSDNSLPSV